MSHRRIAVLLTLGLLLWLAPSVVQAAGERERRSDIRIVSDRDFTRENGVRSGKGTRTNPYVISGWDVGHVELRDTGKAVRIENNTIRHQLTLNWIGPNVLVRKNIVGDLRVNENIERTGAPTSGRIERNHFDVVGQLRHFDGMFMHNVVGNEGNGGLLFSDVRAVNFDGFNGAHFAHNTIYGFMDARLHGHHHSSSFGSDSHMHAASHHSEHGKMVDHSKRYHRVVIEHNRIMTTNWYALSYVDTAHSLNDRRATSETDPALDEPHVHYTRARLSDNMLEGGGVLVDVFNATDDLHERIARGTLTIARNRVLLEQSDPFFYNSGIEIREARGVSLSILDNTVVAPDQPSDPWTGLFGRWDSGVRLERLERATVRIAGTKVENTHYGISAQQMPASVLWTIQKLRTRDVRVPIWYDDTVANKPRRR